MKYIITFTLAANTKEKISKILTSEQNAAWDKIQEERKEKI